MSTPILNWQRFGHLVAADLGEPWDAAPGVFDETVMLVHPAGHRVLLQLDGTGARIVATGTFPPEAERLVCLGRHEISVRADRGPAALAGDIDRRLLPAYSTDLAAAQHRLREKERHDQGRNARVKHLLVALSGDPRVPGHENGDDRTGITWYREGTSSSKITLHGDGSTGDLELSGLPFPLVREICALIVRYERSGGTTHTRAA